MNDEEEEARERCAALEREREEEAQLGWKNNRRHTIYIYMVKRNVDARLDGTGVRVDMLR